MKQSKKLLSIFLAMLMLLGTVSVVANAAQQKVEKGNITYDSIDNAVLTPEQVAYTVLQVLDEDVMPGLGTIEIPVLGDLNLSSIDNAFSSIVDLLGNALLGLAGGDAAKIIDHKGDLCSDGKKKAYKRADGDLECVYALLQFIGNDEVANALSHAPYGILTDNGISGGGLVDLIGGAIDLSDINDILMNLDTFATEMVYDMLIHGSFNAAYADKSYPSMDELKEAGQGLPSEVSTLDKMINTAAYNLLTKPQKYEYVPTGEFETDETGNFVTDEDGNKIPVTEKVWDMSSIILSEDKVAGKDLTLQNNSIFSILDTLLQTAYEDFGTVALNHDVKKLFMEAMGVDFVTLDAKEDAQEITTIKADADYINVEDTTVDASSVKNFFCNAQMWEVNGTWYFRDYVTRPVLDANGNIQYTTDEEGNQVPITALQHRYQRAEAYNANDLYKAFNWGYKLTDTTFNFDQLIPQYGSIIGCLNHILHVILETAIDTGYLQSLGVNSIDELWVDGGNDNFNENLMRTAKFLLKNFTFEFFGRNPLYVNLDTLKANDAFIAKVDSFGNDAEGREGLIAYMLLPFLGDALPQLVYDLDMFTTGLQIEQVAALLVREFLSDLTPQINYDDQIFVDASLKSGRKFQTKTSAQWFELILNMGLDLAAVYLDNISNFNVDLETLETIKGYAVAKGDPAWMGVLEEIVDWAVDYVADGTGYSVINGLEPATLGSVRCVTAYNYTNDTVTVENNYAGNNSAFNIISKALNTLLPLGLLVDVSSDAYALDVKMVFDKLIDVIDDLDLEVLLSVFGRNGRDDNLLGAKNVAVQVLGVVNRLINALFGKSLLVVNASAAEPINNALQPDNLGTTIKNLLTGLNGRKVPLLRSALPVVAVFVDDWGSEQAMRSPTLTLEKTTRANAGSLNYTVTVANGSRGLWRGYMSNGARAQDEQYSYNITSITSLQGVNTGSGYTGKLDFGTTKSTNFTGSIPASGLADMISVVYQIYNEDGQLMENGKSYTKSYYTYFSYEDEKLVSQKSDTYYDASKVKTCDLEATMDKYIYIAEEDLPDIVNQNYFEHYNQGDDGKTGSLTAKGTTTQNGITINTKNLDKNTGGTITAAPFTFNPDAYTSVGHDGAKYTFSYNLNNGKKSGDYTTDIFVYSGADFNLLADLVNEETSKNRQAGQYKSQDAYMNYLSALAAGMQVVYNARVDGNFWTDCYARYENLKAAVEALDATKMTPAEQAAAGADTVDAAVNQLEATLNSVESGLGGKDYRTYMLYRWHRYQDAKNDANRAIDVVAQYAAGPQTQKFEYSSMPVYQLKEAIAGDQYEGYILALLKNLNEEELAETNEHYKDISNQYSGYTTLDIAQISNLVTRMSGRLLPREGGVVNTYLSKEIESAKAEIGATNNAGYSTRSWNAYSDALTKAEAAMTSDSQDVIFAAKYALQVARNNLRTEAEEADYTELEELMGQATAIFWNPALYENTNAEIGAVLAAWGYTTTNGTNTDVFPWSAKAVNARSYDKGDQEEVDDAADALKAALSKMVFKGVNYGSNNVTPTDVPTGEVDANDMPIMESIKTTELTAKQLINTVKGKFEGTTATGATDTEVRISLDNDYSLDTGKEKFVGTGATITIYTTQAGVKIPLSTIKVVVKGDATGDGVIDVLDCMIIELASTDNTTITGVYNIAADIDGVAGVSEGDLGAVANLARAN